MPAPTRRDIARQGGRSIPRARDEAHEGTEAPGSRSAQEVQARHGRLESGTKVRVALDTAYLLNQVWSEEAVPCDIHTIACRQQDVIDPALRAVVEREAYAVALARCRDHRASECQHNPCQARSEPTRAGGPDAAAGNTPLQLIWKASEQSGDRDDAAEPRRPHVCRCIHQLPSQPLHRAKTA